MLLESLARLARLGSSDVDSAAPILEACALIRDAIGADEVYVVQAGDPYFTRIGDDSPPESYEVKQRGYWLVWQELARDPDMVIGAARVSDRIVIEGGRLEDVPGYTHIGCLLPAEESNSEMLVARGEWPQGLSREHRAFIEAARPIMAALVSRLLDSSRRTRQQEQLKALAQVARAFSEARASDNVLQSVATALAKASAFDWVTITIVDDECENVVDRAMNLARHSSTETAELNLRRPISREYLKEVDESRAPRLMPDVMSDDRVTEELRAYYQRAHILSTGSFPLVFQDRLLGFIVFSSSSRHDFDGTEVSFIGDLVSQAATTIKGVRLYQELEQARQIQHFLARTDTLTGVPNRRYFEEVLRAEFARTRRYDEPLCVLMADVDHFKLIN
ncbi:MAG TPA: diguanylate cyclase, partial [Dehalococcoidia bacterium]